MDRRARLTKGIAIADLGPPAAHEVHLVLGQVRHLRVPLAHEVDVLIDLVGLDLVEDDRVHVLAPGQDLTKAGLELGLHLAPFLGAVDEVGERTRPLRGLGLLGLGRQACGSKMISSSSSLRVRRGGRVGGCVLLGQRTSIPFLLRLHQPLPECLLLLVERVDRRRRGVDVAHAGRVGLLHRRGADGPHAGARSGGSSHTGDGSAEHFSGAGREREGLRRRKQQTEDVNPRLRLHVRGCSGNGRAGRRGTGRQAARVRRKAGFQRAASVVRA